MSASAQITTPPKQVRAAVAAAEELQSQIYADEPTPEEKESSSNSDIDTLLSQVTEPSAERVAEAEAEAPAPAAKVEREDWKQKYSVLKGKYDAEVPRLHDQLKVLEGQVTTLIETTVKPEAQEKSAEQPKFKYIAEDELEDYGEDFMDMVGRRAQEIAEQQLAPITAQMAGEISALKAELGQNTQRVDTSEQRDFYAQLDRGVENWRAINDDPVFAEWVQQEVPEGRVGETRLQVLMESFNAKDVSGVKRVFDRFVSANSTPQTTQENVQSQGIQNGQQGTAAATLSLDSLVSPSAGQGSTQQGAPANEGSQKVWTQAEIAKFYTDSRVGKFAKRPEDKAKIEADIVLAAAQGRVR